jgi:hypothetical protein
MNPTKNSRRQSREHVRDAIRRAIGTSEVYRDEVDFAKKAMLTGLRFALHVLGVERDHLLARFVEQEFQRWVKDAQEYHSAPKMPPQRARISNRKTA